MNDLTQARIVAAAVGGGLMFTVGPLLTATVTSRWVLACLLALSYAVVAALVALVWPQLSWRTGLWFFVSFPLVVLASFFFTGSEAPTSWSTEIRNLLDFVFGLVGACVGGWIGALVSTRRD